MLAIIGSSPHAEHLSLALAGDLDISRVPSPDAGSADARLAALSTLGQASGITVAIAATGLDERSLVAAAAAKQQGIPRTVAIVEGTSPSLRAMADRLGIDRIIEPDAELAAAVAARLSGPVAAAVRALGRGSVRVLDLAVDAPWARAGRSLADLHLPAGVRVVLITRRDDRRSPVAPSASTALHCGDRVLLVANRDVAPEAAAQLGSPMPAGPSTVVAGLDPARTDHFLRCLREAGLEATAAGLERPADWAAGPENIVLLDPPDGSEAAIRAASLSARVFTIASSPAATATGDRLSVTPALAAAVRELLPRPPVQRIGTVATGEVDVYRIVAGEHGPWLGIPLRELPGLRGWSVLAIQSGRNAHLPHPEDAVQPGEILIVAGRPGGEGLLRQGFRGED
jgi:Trk K+ transport system NAD-binding subunit